MASVRDAHVDALIFAAKIERDPMGDGASSAEAHEAGTLPGRATASMPSRGRAMAFAMADVPDTVPVKMESFLTADGDRIEEHTIRMATTPKRKASVTI